LPFHAPQSLGRIGRASAVRTFVVHGFGEARRDRDRPIECRDSLFKSPQLIQDDTNVVHGFHGPGPYFQHFVHMRESLVRLPELAEPEGQLKMRLKAIRIDLERL
jgi:hypothetical protein